MEDYVLIYDTTLRDGEQAPGFSMNSSQKLEVARGLERLNVDIIEAGFPGSSKEDYKSVNDIAREIKGPQISALARCKDIDIIAAGEALGPAIERGKGKIHVFIATSQIHRDDKLKRSKEEIIDMAVRSIKKAREYTPYVEFSCEDFARTEIDYTIEIVKAAIDAGATTINLPDTVGYRFPDEIERMVRQVIEGVGRKDIIYSIHCHNDMGLATANALAAIIGGARQIEVTMNGIGERAGNTALEEIVCALYERPDYFKGLKTRINSELIVPTSKTVSRVTGKMPQLNKAITGGNAFRHSSGIHSHGVLNNKDTYEWIDPRRYGGVSELPLTARSGKHQVKAILDEKKIKYDEERLDEIMEQFKDIADQMDMVYDDSLVMAVKGDREIPEHYKIIDFICWYDKKGHAKIKAEVDGRETEVKASGNGMINAIENAIFQLTGIPLTIIDYESKSLSKGGDAKGIESVTVKNNGYTVRGIGISEDTVYGAAMALIDANNRMRYVLGKLKS